MTFDKEESKPSINSGSSEAQNYSKEISFLKEELAEAKKVIETLTSEKSALEGYVIELKNQIQSLMNENSQSHHESTVDAETVCEKTEPEVNEHQE